MRTHQIAIPIIAGAFAIAGMCLAPNSAAAVESDECYECYIDYNYEEFCGQGSGRESCQVTFGECELSGAVCLHQEGGGFGSQSIEVDRGVFVSARELSDGVFALQSCDGTELGIHYTNEEVADRLEMFRTIALDQGAQRAPTYADN